LRTTPPRAGKPVLTWDKKRKLGRCEKKAEKKGKPEQRNTKKKKGIITSAQASQNHKNALGGRQGRARLHTLRLGTGR